MAWPNDAVRFRHSWQVSARHNTSDGRRGQYPLSLGTAMGLIRFIRFLIRFLTRRPGTAQSRAYRPPRVAPDDYLSILRQHPGTRVTTLRLLDANSLNEGVLSRHEHLETQDADGNLRQIDAYHAPMCSFNHLLDQDNHPTSVCRMCGRVMCSHVDDNGGGRCAGQCKTCGESCCTLHRVTRETGGRQAETYCTRHSWRYWWRLWWGYYS